MRTTVTLDSDVEQLLRRRMRERGMTFKDAVNEAIRAGLVVAAPRPRFRTEVIDMGPARINLDRALTLSGELEDEELLRKMRSGK